MVFWRHASNFLGSWHGGPPWWKEPQGARGSLARKELAPDAPCKHLCDKRWDRVAKHLLQVCPPAIERKAVWECLKTTHLMRRELAVRPVKRPDCGARLRLNSPRRLSLAELQEKAPIAGSPSEERNATTSPRMPEIILAFWDRWKEFTPFTADAQRWLVGIVMEIAQSIPRCPTRLVPVLSRSPSLPSP
jgi:hypothetical protein